MKERLLRTFQILFLVLVVCIAGTSVVDAATINVSVNPTFRADLINTLKLQEGTGNPTFTRATTATVQDFEGLIKNVKSGEARFVGARRVQNLLSTNTEGGTSTWTSGGSTAPTLVDDTVNGIRCAKVTFTAASNPGYSGSRIDTATYSTFSFSAGHQYQLSAYVKVSRVLTGGENIRILWTGSNGIGSSYVNASNSAQFVNGLARVTQTQGVLAVTGTDYPVVTIDSAPGSPVDVWITKVQVEDVTGQANTNPSEYVSVGVLPAPYHGAGVDGVKYFNTLNGNTVTGYVVNEATGPLIKSITPGVSSVTTDSTGPLGYLAEGSSTNLFLWSALFLQGYWGTLLNTTTGTATTTSPDGILAGEKLVEDATTNTHYIRQQLTTTAQSYAFSVYAKAGERTRIGLREDQIGRQAVFDLSSGTVVSSGGGSTGSIVAVGNGWYRCTLTGVWGASSVTRNEIYVLPNTATVANTSYAGDGTSGLYIWGAQLEAGAFATSYIPTTSGSVARNTDVLSYQKSGNFSDTAGSVYAEVALPANINGYGRIISGIANALTPLSVDVNGTRIGLWDSVDNPVVAYTNSGTQKVASKWSTGSTKVYANGSSAASGYTGSFSMNEVAVGNNINGNLFGTVRNLKIWLKALTDAQLTTMTSTGVNSIAKSVVPQTSIKSTNGTGLVGWWKFDEGTGTKATDASGLGHAGTLVGSPTWTNGKLGKGLSFNGDSVQQVTMPTFDASASNLKSASYWIYPTSVGSSAAILSTSNLYHMTGAGGTNGNLATIFPDDVKKQCSSLLSTNSWQFVYLDFVNDKIYKNGVDCTTTLVVSWTHDPFTGLIVGHSYASYPAPTGKLDDLRVYNRTLSDAEITALYKSTAVVVNAPTNTSLTRGLVGLWSFDGKDMNWGTNMALDRSGSGNNGTLVSMSTSTSPVAGKIGQGLLFNNREYVTTGGVTSNGSSSVFAWINPYFLGACPGSAPNGCVIAMIANNFLFEAKSAVLDVYGYNFNTPQWVHFANSGIVINKWMHVGFTYDGTTLLGYLNGVQIGTATVPGTMGSGGNINIGGQSNFRLFEGKIDDVRNYNRALSATEVKALYNLGR